MQRERLLELAGITEGFGRGGPQPHDLGKLLNPKQREALAGLVDGTLDSMGEHETPQEYQFWLEILSRLGHGHTATKWRQSLEGEGIL